jgi:hypothetical protein
MTSSAIAAGLSWFEDLRARSRQLANGESAWAWFGLAFAGYLLRRPGTLTHAEFAYEDGKIFYLGSWFGDPLDQLFRPYASYLHLIPRFVGVLERQVQPAWAPFVSNLSALIIAALVVRFIASERLAEAIPNRRIRLACALFFIVMPGMDMILGSITFVQFYLAIFLIAGALASPARSKLGAILFGIALMVASLTGPFSVLFLPLYLGRVAIRRDTDSVLTAVAVGAGAAIQAVLLLVAGGRSGVAPTVMPADVAQVLGVHLATGFVGTRFMLDIVASRPSFAIAAIGISVLATLLLLALRSLPKSWLIVGGYVLAITIGSSLINGSDSTEMLLDPLSVSRYFVIPWFVLGVFLIASASRRNPAAIALVCLLAVGIVGDFRLPSGWNYGWSSQADCIGTVNACELKIFPGTPDWTLRWPGLAATRELPSP